MSINRVTLTGNLTRDPELRVTASGMPVLGFGVAVNDHRKNQQTSQWEHEGQKRSKIEVIVDEIVFMSQQNNSRPVQPMPQAQPIQQAQPMQPVMQQAPQMQPVQQMPVQQQMAGMPQQVDYSIYDQDIPF